MQTILITGGTGLIGKRLTEILLKEGYQVIILSRSPKKAVDGIRYASWDIEKQTIDVDAVQQADHIIHLAGAGVADKRWSAKRKKEILQSRTRSSALLVQALKDHSNKVKTVVSASAIGWYGADPSIPNTHPFTEDFAPSDDFLGSTCKAWEESIRPVESLNKRLVYMRTGIVLSLEGGALKEFAKPVKLGVASILGSGRQMISWIHIDDMCRMYLEAIRNQSMRGAYNAAAPIPVSNKDLVLDLAKTMRGRTFIPMHVPSFALKLALGEMSIEVLKSTTVSSKRIEATGFQFVYPTIHAALSDLVKTS